MEREDWNRRYAARGLLWTGEPSRFLAAEAAGLAPGRALDLACGEGRNAVWLAERGWTVTGVDFSDLALEKAGRLAAARGVEVEWVLADLRGFRPEPLAYDLVLLFYLQVPAEERSPVVASAATAVAPGGTLLVVAHDSENLEHGHGGPTQPEVLYSAGDVVADLAGSKLGVERAEQVRRPVETPEGERVALDLLVRATRPA